MYRGEGLVLPGGVKPTVSVKLPSAGTYTANAVCQTTTFYSPFAASNQVNGKYPHLCIITIPLWPQLLLLIMLWELL